MPHVARTWPPTDLHHVTTRGNAGGLVFLGDADRELFLDLFDEVVEKYEWNLYAWCLLGNHAHIVVRADPDSLWKGMQRLKGVYAMRFHGRHHTSGHLFKRPYHSRPILTPEHLHRGCGYTLRNPARHGLVDRAEDWEWSSFRTVAGLAPPPRSHLGCEPFVEMLGLRETTERLAVMRAYVRDAPPVSGDFPNETRERAGHPQRATPPRGATRARPEGAMIGV